jgi:hypothetical protein
MNISTLISRLTKSELLELRAIIDKQIKIKPDWTRTNIEDLDCDEYVTIEEEGITFRIW